MEPEILQFFAYGHLPENMKLVSRPFGELAAKLVEMLPDNSQREHALDRLLEAKDCAVRALIQK